MIAVDTSALIDLADGEPDAWRYAEAMAAASERLISTVSALELTIVLARRISDPKQSAHALLERYAMTIEPADLTQLRAAQDAFLAYGKGRHRAALNFGDCFRLCARQDPPGAVALQGP